MIDRKTPPAIHPIDVIHFEEPICMPITSHCELVCMPHVQNETSKIELIFDAGSTRWSGDIPSITNGLLLSGTPQHSSIEINAKIDSLGGFIEQAIGMESAAVTIYSLREHLMNLSHIVFDAIENCAFIAHELDQHIRDRKQKLSVNLQKVNILAQRLFRQQFFANSPSYQHLTTEQTLDSVQQSDLQLFHRTHYLNGLRKIVLIGNFSPLEMEEFKNIFSSWAIDKPVDSVQHIENNKGEFHHAKAEALQTAIRIGLPLFNKTHADYPDFLILNTLIGDYFGSRLMKNIREDKGYTYGIGSYISELYGTGHWAIGTEVAKEVKDDVLREIRYEIDRIRTEPIEEQELELVKNYMIGQLLKSADGPYSMMDLYLDVNAYGLTMDFYNLVIQSIHSVNSRRLEELANTYLKWENFTVVTAG